jgi:DNA-binding NtrC family response regulator
MVSGIMGSISSKNAQDSTWQQASIVETPPADGGSTNTPGNEAERGQQGTGSRQAIILVIDDDRTIRGLLHEALNLRGYHVIAVGTVQDAEDILQQFGAAALGLVITDIQLTTNRQAQEGYMLCQRWRASYPTLPFLLMSGDPASQTLPAIRTGAVHFLPKPFTMGELLDTVRQLFRQ